MVCLLCVGFVIVLLVVLYQAIDWILRIPQLDGLHNKYVLVSIQQILQSFSSLLLELSS